jgi:hypothetical protein
MSDLNKPWHIGDKTLLIRQKLEDLIVQATKERSHYYVRSVCVDANNHITQLETENKRLREALHPVSECFNCGGCRAAAREALSGGGSE